MTQQKYPIGIQTFEEIIEGGYKYVDKTAYVAQLVNSGKYYFLSRPRRFGKSLLLSTLHAYFDGKRELFKGLALDSADVDWTPTPVLHFDFNAENYQDPEALTNILNRIIKRYESQYGIDISANSESIPGRFENLIQTVAQQTGKKVAILVDEYDKPLLNQSEDSEIYKRNQAILKGFFSNLKSMDAYIRFAMLTGVARFSKVSIFSDLNNLDDISLSKEYADICGWTEAELTGTFLPGIEALAEERGEEFKDTLAALREYYDGYLFHSSGHRLYNPFSVLKSLKSREIKPYWFDTGTPTFLAELVKKEGIEVPDLDKMYFDESQLLAVGAGKGNAISLMYQTGYLTIDTYDARRGAYRLRFPNREVEYGFAKYLYPMYVDTESYSSPFALYKFKDDIFDGNPESFMQRLQVLLKNQPYDLNSESNYHIIAWLLCILCGTEAQAERHSYQGRSDLEVVVADYIYVFEFKYNQSVEEAMSQLRDRDYAGRFGLDPRPVYLIAANLSPETGLAWQIDRLK